MAKQFPTLKRLKQVLDYNPETGVFVWKMRLSKNVAPGRQAGTVKSCGMPDLFYRYIRVDGIEYLAQRLAWFYVHGKSPTHSMVFKDNDRLNLRLVNLSDRPRLAPDGEFDTATREGRLAYEKAARQKYKDHFRGKDFAKNFGIDMAEYQRMFVEQGGVCAICHRPETATRGGQVKWLAVDHDHETGEVRGLLCQAHNVALGAFQDDIATLSSAISYLGRKKRGDANVIRLVRNSDGT